MAVMMMMMRARRLLVDPKTRSDLLRTCSIALLSFWCLDTKGGKVVLLGLSVVFAWARWRKYALEENNERVYLHISFIHNKFNTML
jgi:hypothetical protein